jgi:hypothetical protein
LPDEEKLTSRRPTVNSYDDLIFQHPLTWLTCFVRSRFDVPALQIHHGGGKTSRAKAFGPFPSPLPRHWWGRGTLDFGGNPMLPSIESTLETMTRKILLSRMRDAGVTMMKGYRVSRIEDTGVVVTGEEEKEIFVEAEKVVMAIGNRSDDTLYDQIQSLGYEIHKIGDCLEPRSAKAAIYEGAVLGRSI